MNNVKEGGDVITGFLNKTAKKVIDNTDPWQELLARQFDEMVDSFLTFPDHIPQDYRDRQFARHLLWKLMDNRIKFTRLFLKEVKPKDLERLWVRLMPYITGNLPDDAGAKSQNLARLDNEMLVIVHEIATQRQASFDQLMDEVISAIHAVRDGD